MPHFPLGLTMGMMLSAPMVLAGVLLLWRGLKEPMPAGLEAAAAQAGIKGGARRADGPA